MGEVIQEESMYRGGRIIDYLSYSDEELALARTTTAMALAYVKGRGPSFGIVANQLRRDLEMLDGFIRSRKAV